MNHRPLRIGQLIRDELAKLFLREVEFPDMLVTITEVDVSKKMDNAYVYVSVIPVKYESKALKILDKSRGALQHLLGRKLNIKPMPYISFGIDRGPENAAKVEKQLLREDNEEIS